MEVGQQLPSTERLEVAQGQYHLHPGAINSAVVVALPKSFSLRYSMVPSLGAGRMKLPGD
jgi:hypothetical protein